MLRSIGRGRSAVASDAVRRVIAQLAFVRSSALALPALAVDWSRQLALPRLPALPGWLTLMVSARFAAVIVVAITAAVTGFNMFNYPHYESDEGTYVSSAWSMLTEGKLSYYTYNYDHPPLGWLIIGLWAKLTGGFMTLGSSVNTGRLFMLLVALASALLIFAIVCRATGQVSAAVCAGVLFAVSPLGLDLHRQVWLDNLSTLTLLVSLYLLLQSGGDLGRVVLSAVAFGMGFWTKEVMVVFLPAMLVLVHSQSHPAHRRFALVLWAATALSLISFFVLLAFLKDEFLPPGTLWSSALPHVSLIDTYRWQMSRSGNGSIFDADGLFRHLFDQWWRADQLVMLGGLGIAVTGLTLGRRFPLLAGISLLALTFLAFLARGGVVLYYYVIPVLALFVVLIGLAVGYATRAVSAFRPAGWIAAISVVLATAWQGAAAVQVNTPEFTLDQVKPQQAATAWLVRNVSRDSIVLMDSYAWVEMREPQATNGQPFSNAHYYWPAVQDPSISGGVLHDNWRTVDYLAVSPSIEADLASQNLPLLRDALDHADQVQAFYSDDWTVRILRVQKLQERAVSNDPFLTASWSTYKQHFLQGGQVVDPKTGNTTSEGQSYALLRAVYADDQTTFDRVWDWTRTNLQAREDGLLAWNWGNTAGNGPAEVLDSNSAADADEDVALALLFAAHRWNAPAYEADALRLMSSIWDQETTLVAGRRVLVAGNWARGGWSSALPQPVVNPSYFAPYVYRIFGQADPSHAWSELVDSSYDILGTIARDPEFGGAAGTVPTWVALDPETGALQPADAVTGLWSQFSYDASRLPWRLAVDWIWFKDDRARQALAQLTLPGRELAANNRLAAAYHVDGTPAADYEATSMYAGTLAGLLINNQQALAHRVFSEKILHAYQNDGTTAYWGDLNDYHDQNWAWFATALMDGGLSNLWNGQTVIHWDEVPL